MALLQSFIEFAVNYNVLASLEGIPDLIADYKRYMTLWGMLGIVNYTWISLIYWQLIQPSSEQFSNGIKNAKKNIIGAAISLVIFTALQFVISIWFFIKEYIPWI